MGNLSDRCAASTVAATLPAVVAAQMGKLSPAGAGLSTSVLSLGCYSEWNRQGTVAAVSAMGRPVLMFSSAGDLLDQIALKNTKYV